MIHIQHSLQKWPNYLSSLNEIFYLFNIYINIHFFDF